jgi:hypothetical protein
MPGMGVFPEARIGVKMQQARSVGLQVGVSIDIRFFRLKLW